MNNGFKNKNKRIRNFENRINPPNTNLFEGVKKYVVHTVCELGLFILGGAFLISEPGMYLLAIVAKPMNLVWFFL